MDKIKIGEIIRCKIAGYQPYGIFIDCLDNEGYSGLIHISEISYDFIKDVSKVGNINDILFAKVLDVDESTKHVKLSIKATLPKNRYKNNYYTSKEKDNHKYSDFTGLEERLEGWIEQQLGEKNGKS